MAHPKHTEVRHRYQGCCGYCGVSEEAAGGEFSVDHFVPTSAGVDQSDDNLVYCCFRCNLYKSDFSPTSEDLAVGHRLIHPTRDHAENHFTLDEASGLLRPKTETGRFHIALLHLNRPALVAHRLRLRRVALLEARKQLLAAEVRELRAIVAAQQKYIERLLELLGEEPE